MAGWKNVLNEVKAAGSTHDIVRRHYLSRLKEYSKRNTIVYYSAWLEKKELIRHGVSGFEVSDNDKNGFMATIHGMDRSLGLDLVIHTPGGDTAATESIVDYIREMFGHDVRVIVPHLAMSAGTMIALSCDTIIMGKHSALGPIDPQIFGMPAHGVVEEFNRARQEISADPATIPLWQPIIAKYTPTLIGECEKAIQWSEEMVREWLATGMFRDSDDKDERIERVIRDFGKPALNKSHARHLSASKAQASGLSVKKLEDDPQLQELVLTTYHTFVATATDTAAIKIIENHDGVAHIQSVRVQRQATS